MNLASTQIEKQIKNVPCNELTAFVQNQLKELREFSKIKDFFLTLEQHSKKYQQIIDSNEYDQSDFKLCKIKETFVQCILRIEYISYLNSNIEKQNNNNNNYKRIKKLKKQYTKEIVKLLFSISFYLQDTQDMIQHNLPFLDDALEAIFHSYFSTQPKLIDNIYRGLARTKPLLLKQSLEQFRNKKNQNNNNIIDGLCKNDNFNRDVFDQFEEDKQELIKNNNNNNNSFNAIESISEIKETLNNGDHNDSEQRIDPSQDPNCQPFIPYIGKQRTRELTKRKRSHRSRHSRRRYGNHSTSSQRKYKEMIMNSSSSVPVTDLNHFTMGAHSKLRKTVKIDRHHRKLSQRLSSSHLHHRGTSLSSSSSSYNQQQQQRQRQQPMLSDNDLVTGLKDRYHNKTPSASIHPIAGNNHPNSTGVLSERNHNNNKHSSTAQGIKFLSGRKTSSQQKQPSEDISALYEVLEKTSRTNVASVHMRKENSNYSNHNNNNNNNNNNKRKRCDLENVPTNNYDRSIPPSTSTNILPPKKKRRINPESFNIQDIVVMDSDTIANDSTSGIQVVGSTKLGNK